MLYYANKEDYNMAEKKKINFIKNHKKDIVIGVLTVGAITLTYAGFKNYKALKALKELCNAAKIHDELIDGKILISDVRCLEDIAGYINQSIEWGLDKTMEGFVVLIPKERLK